jgi:hypothetical protein
MTTGSYLLAGSISKPVAAVRSLQLVEDGVFALDEDVNNYLTSWQVPNNEFTSTEQESLNKFVGQYELEQGIYWGVIPLVKSDQLPAPAGLMRPARRNLLAEV